MFGDSKRVGVAVALLSDSNVPHLHFKASTNECKDWVVGRKLDRLKAQVFAMGGLQWNGDHADAGMEWGPC